MTQGGSILVQTGSVPALLFGIRQAQERHPGGPVAVLALDVENVRQYLREIPELETHYYRVPSEAIAVLEALPEGPIFFLAGGGFRRLRRRLKRRYPHASALDPEQEPGWNEFLSRFHSEIRRDSVLLVQSDSREVVEEYVATRLERHRFQRPSLSILCREDERSYWAGAHPDWRIWIYRDARDRFEVARHMRRQGFDACIVFFTGNFGYDTAKRIAFMAGARQCSAVNEHGGYLQLTWPSLLQFGYLRLRNPASPRWGPSPHVLVVLGPGAPDRSEIIDMLQSDGIFRSPRFSVMTEPGRPDADSESHGWIRAPGGWRDLRTAVRRLREGRFDAAVLPQGHLSALTKLALALAGIRHRLFVDHQNYFFQPSLLRARQWVRRNTGLFQTTRVLILQTCPAGRMSRALERLAETDPFYKPVFSLLADEEGRKELSGQLPWEQILTVPEGGASGGFLKLRRDLRRLRFDAAVVVLSRDSGYSRLKWLPFLAGISHKLLFNRNLDCFFFTPVQFLKYLWNPGATEWTRVLIVQTWDEKRMLRIFDRLAEIKPFYKPRYSLFVREDKRALLEEALPFEQVLTYPEGAGARDYLHSLAQVRREHFDAAVVAFTGERSFRKLKWVPFLSLIRRTLVFNRNFDCNFFTLAGGLKHWLRRPVGVVERPRVLVIQTWDEESMEKIARRLAGLDVFIEPTYSIFTREDKAGVLEKALPGAEVITYPVNAGFRDWWRSVTQVRRNRYDVAVVALPGEASFGKLKLLPFAAGIRHKLVFNRHYDCFFFSPAAFLRHTAARYGDASSSLAAPLRALLFPLVRAVMFPFRFAYLLVRVTGLKMQRAARMRG